MPAFCLSMYDHQCADQSQGHTGDLYARRTAGYSGMFDLWDDDGFFTGRFDACLWHLSVDHDIRKNDVSICWRFSVVCTPVFDGAGAYP